MGFDMLEGRTEHDILIVTSVVFCVLGAIALTIGLFISYGYEEYHRVASGVAGGGGLSIVIGMSVGNYTKWRSQR